MKAFIKEKKDKAKICRRCNTKKMAISATCPKCGHTPWIEIIISSILTLGAIFIIVFLTGEIQEMGLRILAVVISIIIGIAFLWTFARGIFSWHLFNKDREKFDRLCNPEKKDKKQ